MGEALHEIVLPQVVSFYAFMPKKTQGGIKDFLKKKTHNFQLYVARPSEQSLRAANLYNVMLPRQHVAKCNLRVSILGAHICLLEDTILLWHCFEENIWYNS